MCNHQWFILCIYEAILAAQCKLCDMRRVYERHYDAVRMGEDVGAADAAAVIKRDLAGRYD